MCNRHFHQGGNARYRYLNVSRLHWEAHTSLWHLRKRPIGSRTHTSGKGHKQGRSQDPERIRAREWRSRARIIKEVRVRFLELNGGIMPSLR